MVVMTPELLTAVAPLFNVGGQILARSGKPEAGKALSIMGSVLGMTKNVAGAFGPTADTGTSIKKGVDTPFNPKIPKEGEGGLKIIEGKPDLNKPKWLPEGPMSQADARKSLELAGSQQSAFIQQNQGLGRSMFWPSSAKTPLEGMRQNTQNSLTIGDINPTDVSYLFPQQ